MTEKDRYPDTPEGFVEWLRDKYNTVDLHIAAAAIRQELTKEGEAIKTRQRDDGVWEAWLVDPEPDEGSEGEELELTQGRTEAEAVCQMLFGFCVDQGISLPDDIAGLIERAEGIAASPNTGAIMLLTFEEAHFMDQVCQWEGLIVPLTAARALAMADRLESGGLVTVDRSQPGHVIVSAVRPEDESDEEFSS